MVILDDNGNETTNLISSIPDTASLPNPVEARLQEECPWPGLLMVCCLMKQMVSLVDMGPKRPPGSLNPGPAAGW